MADGGKAEWVLRVLGVDLGAAGISPAADDASDRFDVRLVTLKTRVVEALRVGAPQAADAKLKVSKAGVFGRKQEYGAGDKLLDEVEALLTDAARAADAAKAVPGAEFSKVGFEKVHLQWEASKKAVNSRLAKLKQSIRADGNDEAEAAQAKLDGILAKFNEGLGDTLDRMRNAVTPEDRSSIAGQASRISTRYLGYLDTPLVGFIDARNPYDIDVDVKGTLSVPLKAMQAQLATLIA